MSANQQRNRDDGGEREHQQWRAERRQHLRDVDGNRVVKIARPSLNLLIDRSVAAIGDHDPVAEVRERADGDEGQQRRQVKTRRTRRDPRDEETQRPLRPAHERLEQAQPWAIERGKHLLL